MPVRRFRARTRRTSSGPYAFTFTKRAMEGGCRMSERQFAPMQLNRAGFPSEQALRDMILQRKV